MVTAIEGIPVANDVDFVRELSIVKARSSPSPSQQLFALTLRSTTLDVPPLGSFSSRDVTLDASLSLGTCVCMGV